MPAVRFRQLRAWPYLLVALAGLAVYWPGLSGGFIFDDFPNLVMDPDWKVTSTHLTEWSRAIKYGIASSYGRPLALLSFAFNHYLTGLDPFYLKLTNLLIHIVNGWLVYALCTHLIEAAPAGSTQTRPSRILVTFITLAWLLHPLQVSSVLYVVQRMELGAQTGVLLALLAYMKARQRQLTGKSSWPFLALATMAWLCGLGFKESALLAPGFALLIEVFILRFTGVGVTRSRGLMLIYSTGTAAALAVYLFLLLPKYLQPDTYAFRDFTLAQRLLSQGPVLLMYLSQIMLPLPSKLLFYYDSISIPRGLFSPPSTAVSFAILSSLLVAALAVRKRWPLFALGITWFFMAHALTSNVVPLELAFEHRNYLALLGPLIATVPAIVWIGNRLHSDARRTLGCLAVAILAGLCALQAHTWGDPQRLAIALDSRNPNSPRAVYDLGKLMLEKAGKDTQGPLWFMAKKQFEHSASLPNSSPLGEQALIVMSGQVNQPIPHEVWDQFGHKLTRREPGSQELSALQTVTMCAIQKKCHFNPQPLFVILVKVLQQNPHSAAIHSMYGNFAFNVLRDQDLGIRMLREAVRLDPEDSAFRVGLLRFLLASNLRVYDEEIISSFAHLRRENDDGRLSDDLKELEELQSKLVSATKQRTN